MKTVFAYTFPYPFTATERYSLRSCILMLTNREWAQIQKYIPKCCIKLYTSTSKVLDSRRNISLMNRFSGTEWFIILRAVHDKSLFHSLHTHKRQQIFQIVVWLEKLVAHHSYYKWLNISSVKVPLQVQHHPYSTPRRRRVFPVVGTLTAWLSRWDRLQTTASACIPHTQAAWDFCT